MVNTHSNEQWEYMYKYYPESSGCDFSTTVLHQA